MHLDWARIGDYLYGNRVAIGGALMLVITAAVKVWPDPNVPWWNVQTCKEFFYNFSHQALNITNTRFSPVKEETVTRPKA